MQNVFIQAFNQTLDTDLNAEMLSKYQGSRITAKHMKFETKRNYEPEFSESFYIITQI